MKIGWRECRLGDLFEIKHGYAFKGEYFGAKGTHVVLTPGNFFDEGGFKSKGEKEKWYSGEIPKDYILEKGELLVAMTEQAEGLLGSAAIVPKGDLYLHNQRLGLVQNLNGIDSRFLYYVFNSAPVRQQIRSTCSGVKVRHTSPSRIYEVTISVPDLPTQRKIAGILSAYDDLIENNLRRIKILEEMAQSLYREWFVHFRFPGHESARFIDSSLGQIPEGWEAGRLEDVLVLQRGFDLPKAEREGGDVPIYAASGITGHHSESKVKGPGIVTGRSGTIGQVVYVHEDFWPLNTALWVKAFPKSEPLYAYFVLSSIDLKGFNSGAAVPTLNRNDIHGLDALIPPIALQRRFQDHAGAMLTQARTLTLSIQTLRQTRDLLLPKLLSGG
jgi:type I restriction enzyme S subunit